MLAIEINSLEKSYATGFWRKTLRQALKPLTLAVSEHEVLGFLGPNGAGKTTTLKLLMGLIFPTGGHARILGMDIGDPRAKRRIGYSPEQPYFYDYLTAPELLGYFEALSGVPERGRAARIAAVLEKVGLPEVGKLQLRKFSKGMLQRVSIAQAILHNPDVIFLDEPMSGLDPLGRREVRDLIQELKDAGKTIFFSTHILSDAEALCDRVAVLNKGELRGVGSIADLRSQTGAKVEIQWTGAPGALRALTNEIRISGDLAMATLPEELSDSAVEAVRAARGHLVALLPVRATLEDYFLKKISSSADAEVRS